MKKKTIEVIDILRERFGELHVGDRRICPECGKEYRVGWDEEAHCGRWNFCSYGCCRKYVDKL